MKPINVSLYELESSNIKKLVTRYCSENQCPALCLLREVYAGKLVYNLYLKSHADETFLRMRFFRCLDDFVLWYITDKYYTNFQMFHYSNTPLL